MKLENIKNDYLDICNNYIKPYLDSKRLYMKESYLGVNVDTGLYVSGWDGNNMSTIIPLMYGNNGFAVVNKNMNPIYIHEWIDEMNNIISDQGLYDTDIDTNTPNYKIMVTNVSECNYESIKELKLNSKWV